MHCEGSSTSSKVCKRWYLWDGVITTATVRLLPASGNRLVVAAGLTLIAIGQVFNFGVFYQLGSVGVFYGNRFGYEVSVEYRLSILGA